MNMDMYAGTPVGLDPKIEKVIREQNQAIKNLKELLYNQPLPLQAASGVNDLWILHQDKIGIVKFYEVWINKYYEKYCIEINSCDMGYYSTKEKAKAVLLAIWDCLNDGDEFYKMPSDEEVEV